TYDVWDGTTCAHTPVSCTPNQCQTGGGCNAANGECNFTNKPNGAACDDGDAATTNDVCADGICTQAACTCDQGLSACVACYSQIPGADAAGRCSALCGGSASSSSASVECNTNADCGAGRVCTNNICDVFAGCAASSSSSSAPHCGDGYVDAT